VIRISAAIRTGVMHCTGRALVWLLPFAWACGGGSGPAVPRFWDQATLHDAFMAGGTSPDACAASNPGALPCNYFIDRGGVADGAGATRDVLQIKLAFSEHDVSAYITTDFWQDWNEIWLQPMYVLVTGWNAMDPEQNRLPAAPGSTMPSGPIFTVGTHSAFYSPYHAVTYVEVPPGTDPAKYTSAHQIVDAGLPMHAGPNRFCSLDATPAGSPDVYTPNAAEIRYNAMKGETDVNLHNVIEPLLKPNRTLDEVAASAQQLTGWLDGQPIAYVDFGPEGYTADGDRVVQDVPLFLFTKPNDQGVPRLIGEPNVAGIAPLFSGLPASVAPDHRPHFGALWRIYYVLLPPSAGALTDPATQLSTGVLAAVPAATIAPFVHRVVGNPVTCFQSATFPKSTSEMGECQWLDSQAAIEALGPDALVRTTLEPACPFVMWKGFPVPNPPTVLVP
jgi:hypothetical protein